MLDSASMARDTVNKSRGDPSERMCKLTTRQRERGLETQRYCKTCSGPQKRKHIQHTHTHTYAHTHNEKLWPPQEENKDRGAAK